MATLQFGLGNHDLYKSPYSFIPTYDRPPTIDQAPMKDEIRSDKPRAHIPTSSYHLVGGKPTNIDSSDDASDGYADIDEFLLDIPQKNSIVPGSTAEKMDIAFRSGISAAFAQAIKGSTQDLSIAGFDETMSVEVETLEVDLTTTNDPDPPHSTISDRTGDISSRSRTTLPPDPIFTDHQDGNNHCGISTDVGLQLATDRSTPAPPSHESLAHQVNPIQANPKITQITSSSTPDIIEEADDKAVDVFIDDRDDADTYSTRNSDLSIGTSNKLASDLRVSSLVSQSESAHNPQRRPAVASQDDTKIGHYKRLRIPAPTASPVSAAPESNGFERTQLATSVTDLADARDILDIDQEMADGGGSDDSDDEDYDATSEIVY